MLVNEDLLLPEKNKLIYRLVMEACEKNGFKPNVVYTDDKFENLVDLVNEGMGIALLMKQAALYVANSKTVIVDISPSVTAQMSLFHLKGTELSDAAKHFVLCTRQQLASRAQT
jgi:DNA-binding transcriptional LysR family regulator